VKARPSSVGVTVERNRQLHRRALIAASAARRRQIFANDRRAVIGPTPGKTAFLAGKYGKQAFQSARLVYCQL
jgi:hypothetical protein